MTQNGIDILESNKSLEDLIGGEGNTSLAIYTSWRELAAKQKHSCVTGWPSSTQNAGGRWRRIPR